MGQYDAEVSLAFRYAARGTAKQALHVPIDSFILEAMKNENVPDIAASGGTYKYNNKAWSQIGEDDYKKILKIIRELADNSPIEWENTTWIRQAEKRKNPI